MKSDALSLHLANLSSISKHARQCTVGFCLLLDP
jgi:hypothetical protein